MSDEADQPTQEPQPRGRLSLPKLDAPSGGILAFFIHHRNAANLIMAMMILFGVIGLMRLNSQFFPTIDVPRISITIAWSGASAEDVERNILEAVEPTIRFLDDLDKITSYAREGSASISLEFADGADLQKAQSDVETAIAAITTLPQAAEEPVISRAVWYEQVGKLSLSGPFNEPALRSFAREIRDDLLAAGIDKVEMTGFRDREYWIDVPEWQLRRLGLSVGDIAERVGAATRDMPSGTLDGAVEKQLRSIAVEDDPESLAAIEIVSGADGEKVFLGEIATIRPAFDDTQTLAYRFGTPAIELSVQRSIASDTLESRRVFLDYVDGIEDTLPPNLEVAVYDIFADRLQDRIGLLVENGLQGLFFVLITLFIFLNARIAFWVAVGIPAAVMAALGFMWLSGQSINMISLFALIMVLGIIVDDAIVVGEHTATRYAAGDSAALAAETGAKRMFWPVFAAILTTQAAFLAAVFRARCDRSDHVGIAHGGDRRADREPDRVLPRSAGASCATASPT
jgi:multidrug efflux pump subunit AcrB